MPFPVFEGFDNTWSPEYRFAFVGAGSPVVRGGDPTGLTVERADIPSPEARALIEALNAELSSRYPEAGAAHFRLEPGEVAPGRGAFLIVARAGKPVGCGAVRRIEAGIAEIKRMYVSPEARGQRVGRAVPNAFVDPARGMAIYAEHLDQMAMLATKNIELFAKTVLPALRGD